MSKLDRWVDHKVAQNLFIWFFLFLILMTAIQTEDRVSASLFAIMLLVPPIYINNLFILPYLKKKAIYFFSLFLFNLILFTGVSVFILSALTDIALELNLFFNFIGILLLALIFASALKIARDSFTRRQQEKEAELKLLKAQLNPHFLFNTLNNLYGLSVIKSDKLPALMLKLSDLLRYSLYETKEVFVPLEKEIAYLENYIALEKIRLEDSTDISFEKEGALSSHHIAPMLLIVFVENAFKHLGAPKKEKSNVIIRLKILNDSLLFQCVNSIDSTIPKETNLEKGKSGIGLQNAQKRLALIYPDEHQLKTASTSRDYSVSLELFKIKPI